MGILRRKKLYVEKGIRKNFAEDLQDEYILTDENRGRKMAE